MNSPKILVEDVVRILYDIGCDTARDVLRMGKEEGYPPLRK